jgi:signal transduction histidine kinase
MLQFSFDSLRFRLLMLVLIAIIPSLGLTVYTGFEQRRAAALEAQANALWLVRITATDQDRLIADARQLLSVLAHLPNVRNCNPATFNAFLAGLLQDYPLYANLGVANLDGTMSCSASAFDSPLNVADHSWFRRVLQTRNFAIGDYEVGRTTGNATISFAHPVHDDQRVLQAVAFVVVDLGWLSHRVTTAQLPPGSTLTVIDRNGTILSRYPEPEKWVGKGATEAPIVAAILTRQKEGTAEAIGVDGIRRLYAFTTLGSTPQAGDAFVYAGIPTTIIYARADQLLFGNLVGLGLVMVIGLVVAWVISDWFILRRVNALVSVTQQLADGDLTVRSGLPYGNGELDHLAHSFDKMADSLEKRAVERKQAEEALRQNAHDLQERNEELDAFAHTVAHDLKNPLSLIVGFAELLDQSAPTTVGDEPRRILDGIIRSAQTMNNIIDELLLLAGMRRLDVQAVPLNMFSVVAQAQQRLAHMIDKYQAEISLPNSWPVAAGYGPWVEEVWVNYISNAVKYGGRPPRVELGAKLQPDGQIRFWVRDNGDGIAAEDQSKLFMPFTRLGQARAKGHGLGLSIVKRIVEKLGGQVGVESDGIPGYGSVFYFTLPAEDRE